MIKEFTEYISSNIQDRFTIFYDEVSKEILSLSPEELSKKNIMRLKRINNPLEINNRKTILLVCLENIEQLTYVLKWASIAKEILLDPESADLYLFICFNNEITSEMCIRIESTDQFCRKYVLRPSETYDQFLERTFLAKPNSSGQELLSTDPLLKAFSLVEEDYDWFSSKEQNRWKSSLLSGLTGSDLIEDLFTSNISENETPE